MGLFSKVVRGVTNRLDVSSRAVLASAVVAAVVIAPMAVSNAPVAQAAGSTAFNTACTNAGGSVGTNGLGQGTCAFNASSSGRYGTLRNMSSPKGLYRLEAYGAQGGSSSSGYGPGLGAYVKGDFNFTSDVTFYVLVGQQGEGPNSWYGTGGGGGTFITPTSSNGNLPYVVAGGGGGEGWARSTSSKGLNGNTNQQGLNAQNSTGVSGYGGSSGLGGNANLNQANTTSSSGSSGSGGGGFYGPGYGYSGWASGGTVYPGAGGTTPWLPGHGGYGGGGAAGAHSLGGSGGGGGYSGGGAGFNGDGGGGGGSYVSPSATNVTYNNTTLARSGNGYALITELSTPHSVTSSTATILNDSAPTSTLNWNFANPEKVRLSYTVANTDTTKGAFTDIVPTLTTLPAGWSASDCTWVQTYTSIAPGDSATFIADCTPPEAWYRNTASTKPMSVGVTATFGGTWNGAALSSPATGTTDTLTAQAIYNAATLIETVAMGTPDGGTAGQVGLGDQVRYTTTINNTGTNALTNNKVTSTTFTAHANNDFNQTCPVTIAPGTSGQCVTTFTANQTDVSAATLTNASSLTSTPTYGGSTQPVVTLGPAAQNSITVERAVLAVDAPSINMITDIAPSGFSAGDTVRWSTVIRNNGSVALRNVTATDQANRLFGTVGGYSVSAGGTSGLLYTSNYILTAADTASTPYTETVSASAYLSTCSTNCAVLTATGSTTTTVTVYAPNAAASTRTQTITPDTAPTSSVNLGDSVAYSFTIQNNGNIAWDQASMTDVFNNVYTCSAQSVAISGTTTCTSTFKPTSAQLTGTTLDWTPTFTYRTVTGEIRTLKGATTTLPSIVSVKKLEITSIVSNPVATTPITAGSTRTFTYTVKNSGNLPITGGLKIATSDNLSVTCPVTTLAVNATTTCNASKTF